MKENPIPLQFVKVDPKTILSFLDQASQRTIIAKPGYSVAEINKLVSKAKKDEILCKVYVDTDEKSIRYGFGTQEALDLINQNIDRLNVQSANFIRMAIIIADDKVMVYSPVALYWEEIPERIDFPNGFIGGESLADSLLEQIEGENLNLSIEGLDISIQTCPVTQKAPAEIQSEISTTLSKLEKNPPVDPATLQKTRIYRQNYKLLKMAVKGVNIREKSISLQAFNRIMPRTSNRLKSSWRVLTKEDVKNLTAIKEFLKSVNKIKEKYTFDAKRFGTLIESKNIRNFENCITFKVYALVNQLMGANKADDTHPTVSGMKSLVDLLNESRKALAEYMIAPAMADQSCWKKLFEHDVSLYQDLMAGKIDKKIAVSKATDTFIDYKLKFPKAQNMIEEIHVEFDYYDISDELLAKEEFMKQIKKFDVQIRKYQEGYEKKRANNI